MNQNPRSPSFFFVLALGGEGTKRCPPPPGLNFLGWFLHYLYVCIFFSDQFKDRTHKIFIYQVPGIYRVEKRNTTARSPINITSTEQTPLKKKKETHKKQYWYNITLSYQCYLSLCLCVKHTRLYFLSVELIHTYSSFSLSFLSLCWTHATVLPSLCRTYTYRTYRTYLYI